MKDISSIQKVVLVVQSHCRNLWIATDQSLRHVLVFKGYFVPRTQKCFIRLGLQTHRVAIYHEIVFHFLTDHTQGFLLK